MCKNGTQFDGDYARYSIFLRVLLMAWSRFLIPAAFGPRSGGLIRAIIYPYSVVISAIRSDLSIMLSGSFASTRGRRRI